MSTRDHFYPGFEVAGLETRVDRWLTCIVCGAVLAALAVHHRVRAFLRWMAPYPEPEFDA